MPTGILGKKLGMTRVFDEKGAMVPVTVIEAGPCPVLQVKEPKAKPEKDPQNPNYRALALGFGDKMTPEQWDRVRKNEGKLKGSQKGLKRPMLGLLKKAGWVSLKRFVKEVPIEAGETWKPGDVVTVAVAEGWRKVDVVGTSKGRGTQGTIRRHHFKRGPAAHGTKNIRQPGSVGMKSFPGRTLKGKRLYGRMGNAQATVRSLRVVKLDKEKNLLLVEGAVPGPTGGFLVVRKALTQTSAERVSKEKGTPLPWERAKVPEKVKPQAPGKVTAAPKPAAGKK